MLDAVTALEPPASVSERNSAPPGDAGAAKSASAASGFRSADMRSRGSSCSSTARNGNGAARGRAFAGAARAAAGATGCFAVLLRPGARIGARTRVRDAAGAVARAACFALRLLLDPIVSPPARGTASRRWPIRNARQQDASPDSSARIAPNALFRKDNRLRTVGKCHKFGVRCATAAAPRAARGAHRARRRDVRHAIAARHADDIRRPASGPDGARHRAARWPLRRTPRLRHASGLRRAICHGRRAARGTPVVRPLRRSVNSALRHRHARRRREAPARSPRALACALLAPLPVTGESVPTTRQPTCGGSAR